MLCVYAVIYLLGVKTIIGEIISTKCESKQTCDECIQDIDCTWCILPERDLAGHIIHCRSIYYKNNWCKSGNEAHKSKINILENKAFSNHTDHPIQMKPQRIKLTLRKGEKYNISFQYKMTENFPVDLYYIMDLSNSMRPYKTKLAELGNDLAESMRELTTNFRLGFGSFIDKVELPFVATGKKKLISPCKECASPYSFTNDLPLSNDSHEFVRRVKAANVSGNLDSPEGGFDAIMQAMVCKDKIGWREHARHLLVLSTDDEYHIAGDGKHAGVVEPNPAKCYDGNEEYLNYDYPSISQINHIAKLNSINIIFAIVNKPNSRSAYSYNQLSKRIETSNFGLLDEQDDNNVINLIVENYKKIVEVVKITSDTNKEVDVKFSSNCKYSNITGRCSNVHVGDILNFTATIEPKECSLGRKKIIKIHPEALEQSLIIELEIICQCSCSKKSSPTYEERSEKCSGEGDLKCGVCDCVSGRFGKNCQCDKTYSQSDNITQCIMEGSTEICSGLGECKCGTCECFSRNNKDEEIYGQFCQCNNYSCRKENGVICSGNGQCDCKVCKCNAGYSGDACQCQEGTAKCISPGTDMICSDHGHCVCGQCECTVDKNRYTGKYCEKCISCAAQRCEELRNCATCKFHKTGQYNKEDCDRICNYTIREIDKLSTDSDLMIKKCRVSDNDSCIIMFEYFYLDKEVIVQVLKNRICSDAVDVLAWIIWVIVTIVLAGIIMLVFWKICTTINDRREYAKFEKERLKMKWETIGNPLYKKAETRFENPIFRKSTN